MHIERDMGWFETPEEAIYAATEWAHKWIADRNALASGFPLPPEQSTEGYFQHDHPHRKQRPLPVRPNSGDSRPKSTCSVSPPRKSHTHGGPLNTLTTRKPSGSASAAIASSNWGRLPLSVGGQVRLIARRDNLFATRKWQNPDSVTSLAGPKQQSEFFRGPPPAIPDLPGVDTRTQCSPDHSLGAHRTSVFLQPVCLNDHSDAHVGHR